MSILFGACSTVMGLQFSFCLYPVWMIKVIFFQKFWNLITLGKCFYINIWLSKYYLIIVQYFILYKYEIYSILQILDTALIFLLLLETTDFEPFSINNHIQNFQAMFFGTFTKVANTLCTLYFDCIRTCTEKHYL